MQCLPKPKVTWGAKKDTKVPKKNEDIVKPYTLDKYMQALRSLL